MPLRRREAKHEQYGHQSRGIAKCPECGNVQFAKKWHASFEQLKARLKNRGMINVPEVARMKRCPACTMVKDRKFEGEIRIIRLPPQYKQELLNLVRNFGVRATRRDPQDRIISVEERNDQLRVTTTENQLAHKLAKKIKDVFLSISLQFSISAEPFEVSRIYAAF